MLVKSFLISIVANLATSAGTKILKSVIDNSVYRKIDSAYSKALKSWCKNEGIINSERIWTEKRLKELQILMSNPTKKNEIPLGTLELLNLFKLELQKDPVTWHYLESEFYNTLTSNQITITNHLETLLSEIRENQINPIEIKNKLLEQVIFQVNKNILSGKYIPDTFMEARGLKEHIRYFSDPFLFYERIYSKIEKFNFNYLHRKQTQSNIPQSQFHVEDIHLDPIHDFSSIYENSNNIFNYLDSKYNEFYTGDNETWKFSMKLKRTKDDFNFLRKRIFILKANAGQGKTNFICDYVSNILVKRELPGIYLNGFEINPNSIEQSFSHALYPSKNYSFNNIISCIENYCISFNTPFVIIIDGLNENSDPKLFCRHLEIFIKEVLNYNFIKIIITCRTEYYNYYFLSLEQLFDEHCIVSESIHSILDKQQKNRLINNYLKFFNIQTSISDRIKNHLTDNILLLRIFSEAYKNQILGPIYNLHKDELFQIYYKKMCDSVADKLSSNSFGATSIIFIKEFIENIISYMIRREQFSNIPIKEILGANNTELFDRFLDENILLRRDIITSQEIFGNIEVINFTYDEFRDFLITRFLIDKTYHNSKENFHTYVSAYTEQKHQLSEGVQSFLFIISKKHNDKGIYQYFKLLPNFKAVFLKHIWEINEDNIEDEDINLIKELFPDYNKKIVYRLSFEDRWDTNLFKKLNITIIFEIVNSFSDDELYENFFLIFENEDRLFTSHTNLDNLLDQFQDILLDDDFFKNKSAHNLFEFLLYLTPFYFQAESIYGDYIDKFNNKEQALRVAESCSSSRLKSTINQILHLS